MPLTTDAQRGPREAGPDGAAAAPGSPSETSTSDPVPQRSAVAVGDERSRGGGGRWAWFLLVNVVVPLLLIAAGAAVVRYLGIAEAKPVPPPGTSPAEVLESLPEVRVEPVRSLRETGQPLEIVIDGNVVPFREALVSAEVAGRVIFKSDNCEAGSVVRKGDVLMRIDPTDYELEVQRLRQQREREYRALGEVDQEMVNTKRSLQVARQELQLQQKELERQKALKKFASEAEVDRAKSALLQASQQLVTLENQLDLLRSRRSRLEAAEQLAATQLKAAEINLQRCEVRAPISGVIAREEADVNTFVDRGTPLLAIEQTEKAEITATMRMDQLQWVLNQADPRSQADPSSGPSSPRQHAHAGFELPDTPAIIEYEVAGRSSATHRWKGTLVSYDGIGLDPNTRTVPVRIVVDDPDRYLAADGTLRDTDPTTRLLRGMFVRVRLQVRPKSDLVVVPGRALRPGNKVWKFSPDPAVLEEAVAKAEQAARKTAAERGAAGTATETAASATEAPPPEVTITKASFDPSQWAAGLVRYSETVYPIDALRVAADSDLDPDVSPLLQSERRFWVCEPTRSDLGRGDYVVVSPLDSVPPSGLPARASLEQ